MAITYRIDGRILIIQQNVETDPQRITAVIGTALRDTNLLAGACMLWDARSAPAQADPDSMRKLLAGFAAITDRLSPRFALLVANDLQFGVSRMLAAYADSFDLEVRCFYDEDEARAWLLQAS